MSPAADGPADPAQDSSVVTTHTTKSTTTYISPEPQYVKAEGPLPWIMHKLVVGGTITLAWLLLSSTAALAGIAMRAWVICRASSGTNETSLLYQ